MDSGKCQNVGKDIWIFPKYNGYIDKNTFLNNHIIHILEEVNKISVIDCKFKIDLRIVDPDGNEEHIMTKFLLNPEKSLKIKYDNFSILECKLQFMYNKTKTQPYDVVNCILPQDIYPSIYSNITIKNTSLNPIIKTNYECWKNNIEILDIDELSGETLTKIVIEKITGKQFVLQTFTIHNTTINLDCYNDELKLALQYNNQSHYSTKSIEDLNIIISNDIQKINMCHHNGIYFIIIPYLINNCDIAKFIGYYFNKRYGSYSVI